VTVTNRTKKATKGLQVQLETPPGVIEDPETPVGITAIVQPEEIALDLAAGETKRVEFRVMPSDRGVLGLFARVTCHGEECPDEPHPLTRAGTFDATEITKAVVVEKPSIVGSK
jgi:hypothetical protein